MARSKRETARAKPRGKALPKGSSKAPKKKVPPPPTKTRVTPKRVPKKAAPKARKPAAAAPVKPPPKKRTAAQKPLQKPATKPTRKAVQKPRQAPKRAPKRKRQKKLSRNYERRIRRAELVAQALGLTSKNVRSIARGHPRRELGEIGLSEIRHLRAFVQLPSPGQQRKAGVANPVSHPERHAARERVAEVAGLAPDDYKIVPDSTARTRRSAAAERFAEIFVALGLGTDNDAYTLWFSP